MKDDGTFMVPSTIKAMKGIANKKVLANLFGKFLTNPAQNKKLVDLYQSKDENVPVVFGRLLTDALFHAPMNFMHRGLKAAGLDVRHVILGKESSLPFQLVEGSPAKAALVPFGAFHYSDHVLFFKPDPMGEQADAFKVVPNGSNHIRRLLMDFVRNGYGGKAVKKLVVEDAELGNPRLSIWTEKRDLPLNWQLAGLALTLDKQ
jgi:carboxylesterase type B